MLAVVLGLFVLLSGWLVEGQAPSCSTFQGAFYNLPEPAENGTFSSASTISQCNVFDETRVDQATFQDKVTITDSKFEGAAILRSEFVDLEVSDTTWSNVDLDGTGLSGTLRFSNGRVDFSDGIGISARAVELSGISGRHINFGSSVMGSLLIEDCDIYEWKCDTCHIGNLTVRRSKIEGLNFEYVVSSQVIVEDSTISGAFLFADLVNGSNSPPKLVGKVNLTHSIFDGANIAGISIEGDNTTVVLDEASFEGANLSHAYLVGITGENINFVDADLTDANLSNSQISANTTGSNMNGTDTSGAMINDPMDDSNGEGSGGRCFPAYSTVELDTGRKIFMKDVQIGDRVRVSETDFSYILFFTHRLDAGDFDFLNLETADGRSISLTAKHLLYVNGELRTASSVRPNDLISDDSSLEAQVTRVSKRNLPGLYNPHTLHGDIIVNGIRASCYTTEVPPRLAHFLLAPERLLFRAFRVSLIGDMLHNPAQMIYKWTPFFSSKSP